MKCGCVCTNGDIWRRNVVGFAGQIGYALVPMIARGVMLGADQPVILHMLDIPPAAEALNGVKMELVDAAFPLLKGIFCVSLVLKFCSGIFITNVFAVRVDSLYCYEI